jgi:hypothetical protein
MEIHGRVKMPIRESVGRKDSRSAGKLWFYGSDATEEHIVESDLTPFALQRRNKILLTCIANTLKTTGINNAVLDLKQLFFYILLHARGE